MVLWPRRLTWLHRISGRSYTVRLFFGSIEKSSLVVVLRRALAEHFAICDGLRIPLALCRLRDWSRRLGDTLADQIDLVFAVLNWPVAAALANGLDLLEQSSLVPMDADLRDPAIVVELNKVELFQRVSNDNMLCWALFLAAPLDSKAPCR